MINPNEKEDSQIKVAEAVETVSCPYCGEDIRANAKKCKHCGEWLAEGIVNSEAGRGDYVPAVRPTAEQPAIRNQDNHAAGQAVATPSNATGLSNNIVVNVQNTNVVEQTQTVVVQESKESAPGWIIGEMWLFAAGIGWAMSSWLWFFGLGIGLTILLMIPFVGALLCYIVGAAWGVLAGAICAGIWNPTVGWIVGIIVAILSISFHIEARKKNMEEMNND